MIILALLALRASATWIADNKQEAVVNIQQQYEETETVCASGSTCSKAIDTTTPYNQISSGRLWGVIIWKVEISVKRNTAGADHQVTVTVPKATNYPNAGNDLVKACTAKATYTSCIAEVYPQSVAPRGTITFNIANSAGAAVTVKIKVTGINSGRTVLDDVQWTRNLEGKEYMFRGWPDWKTARGACEANKNVTGVEMCLTSMHSDNERDIVAGVIASKGLPGGWIGQTDGVALGKWEDVNSLGWKWADGSDTSYISPWTITAKQGTSYDSVGTQHINSPSYGRIRAWKILAFAGSAYIQPAFCGVQLVNKEWSGMNCGYRWAAICAPCMASGSKRLRYESICHQCRLPRNPKYPNQPALRCYDEGYCNERRKLIDFSPKEEPTNWGKIVGTTLGIIIPIALIGYCCFYKGKDMGGELIDEE